MDNRRKVTFSFKRFGIDDSHCGMKVGTDGVVTGAWVRCEDAVRVVDVGSGSGLIALMIAQRCNAIIDAIETDTGACADARANIAASPWHDRIRLFEGCFTNYRPETPIDLIVSNPAFFTDGDEAPQANRALARHQATLGYASLIDFASRVLAADGRLAFIFPSGHDDEIIYKAEMSHLKLRRICHLRQRHDRPYIRDLYEFSRIDGSIEKSELTIRNADNQKYTDTFAGLCRDFYLEL